jgi:hypothetical protein
VPGCSNEGLYAREFSDICLWALKMQVERDGRELSQRSKGALLLERFKCQQSTIAR